MSRPRKPYGPNPPGRLQATMVKVLAAELSDAGRLSRGKRYWADDAVIDIVIGHGAVTAEVQGGRSTPYVVTIEADGGAGVPARRELWVQCTCPDDDGSGRTACKHAVATLFALSDEIAIDPDVIDRWRASRRRTSVVTELPRHDADDDPEHDDPEHGRSARVIEFRPRTGAGQSRSTREPAVESVADPTVDEINRLLAAPSSGPPPELPEPDLLDHPPIGDGLLAEVFVDALDQLMIRWE